MMIKKIFTGLLAMTMALNVTFSLTAFAKENTSKVTIKTVPPQEWLDEGNYEFSVEFNGDKKKHAFLDKDNGFENTVELTMMQSYTVSFSDEVANYEIGGIDTDFFIPDKEEMTVVLSFKGSGDIAKTNDDGKISEEQAERLAEAREVVQTYINSIEEDGVNEMIENRLFYIQKIDTFKDRFFDNSDIRYTPEEFENMTNEEKYIYVYIQELPRFYLDCSKTNLTDDDIYEQLIASSRAFTETEEKIMNDAKPVWKWLYEQGVKYGDMPELYSVYLDMKNGVEYETEDGNKTMTEDVQITDVEEVTKQRAENSKIEADDSSQVNKSDNSTTEQRKSKNKLLTILKENIGIIIALAALGVILNVIRKIKKSKEDKDDE